jgi:hypothetical protein
MRKAKAIELLGGTPAAAAKEVGVTYQAVDKWPDPLPRRIADRVLAAVARKHLPASLIGEEAAPPIHTPPPPPPPPPAAAQSAPAAVGG